MYYTPYICNICKKDCFDTLEYDKCCTQRMFKQGLANMAEYYGVKFGMRKPREKWVYKHEGD